MAGVDYLPKAIVFLPTFRNCTGGTTDLISMYYFPEYVFSQNLHINPFSKLTLFFTILEVHFILYFWPGANVFFLPQTPYFIKIGKAYVP